MKINCVVVTYNRLNLLKENIDSLLNQTYKLNKIFIIDNNSNDGTREYLNNAYNNHPTIKAISLKENIGGAGGFSYGIKYAVEDGCDWVWIMDDDTIPQKDTLEKLTISTSASDNIGFLCSKVIWSDKSPHFMNIPSFAIKKRNIPFNYYSGKNPLFLVNNATFVSLLINSNSVKQIGLPIAEFFIWHDDIEYTERILKGGYIGLYVDNSIVLHKTNENYYPHIDTAPSYVAWKFYYQIRNTIYMKRINSKSTISFWASIINKYRINLFRINRRKDNKKAFFKCLNKGFIDGIKFKPTIKYLD